MNLEALQDYQITNFVTPNTPLEIELMSRFKHVLSFCGDYETLEDRIDELEDDLSEFKRKEDHNKYLQTFFNEVVWNFEQENGKWPAADPWDDNLKQAIFDSIGKKE
jgi:hypothetical protein